jgi:hypothetical protein
MEEPMIRLVILESPYAGTTEEEVIRNVGYARRAMRDSLIRGEAPIASHLLYTQPGVLLDKVPEERALGIAAGLAWSKVAHAAVIYNDLGITPGMAQGICRHQAEGTIIEYRQIGTTACHSCLKADKTCPVHPQIWQSCGQYQPA